MGLGVVEARGGVADQRHPVLQGRSCGRCVTADGSRAAQQVRGADPRQAGFPGASWDGPWGECIGRTEVAVIARRSGSDGRSQSPAVSRRDVPAARRPRSGSRWRPRSTALLPFIPAEERNSRTLVGRVSAPTPPVPVRARRAFRLVWMQLSRRGTRSGRRAGRHGLSVWTTAGIVPWRVRERTPADARTPVVEAVDQILYAAGVGFHGQLPSRQRAKCSIEHSSISTTTTVWRAWPDGRQPDSGRGRRPHPRPRRVFYGSSPSGKPVGDRAAVRSG